MKKLLLIATVLLAGCSAALIERLSTDKFIGNEKEPFISEITVDSSGWSTITKQVRVNNPLPYAIEATVKCRSIMSDDPIVKVKARTVKFFLQTAGRQFTHDQDCFITEYVRDYEVSK
jgi:hypothetical protein